MQRAGAFATGGRGSQVMGVRCISVAGEFGVNARPARLGMPHFLKDNHASAFAHDETVAFAVERPGGFFRVVVPRAHGFHRAKAADADRNDRGFGPAGQHDRGIPHFDRPPGLANGVVGGRASGAGGEIRPAKVEVHRNKARRHVGYQHRDHERREPPGPALQENGVLFCNGLEPANAGADENAALVGVDLVEVDSGIPDGLPGGMYTELGITISAPDILGRGKSGGNIKVFYLGSDLSIETRRVKGGDLIDAAASRDEVRPKGIQVVAHGRNDP